MPRRPRIHQTNAYYHVTLRGNHQQDIFRSGEDRRLLNTIVARWIANYGAKVHAYCWMSNHVHLLVQVGTEPLGSVMRQIASEYARAFQRKLQTTGHLFERRYHASFIHNDRYLLAVVHYIHYNPVEARLVRAVAEYPWSSHGCYAGERTETWLTTGFVLDRFSAVRPDAIAAYLKFMDLRPEEVLPSDGEMSSLDALMEHACARFNTSLAELQADNRDERLMKARAWISHRAIENKIANLSELSRILSRDRATLRYAMQRFPSKEDEPFELIPTFYTGT